MKKQREFDYNIIRSNSRVRESVRSLPKGHFQQIRQMFDTQTNSGRKLSTIYERQQKSVPSHVLLRLPVTDDEKLKHTTNIEHDQSLEDRYRDYLAEYQAFRLKITNELNHHKTIYPSKNSLSLPDDNQGKKKNCFCDRKHRQLIECQKTCFMSFFINHQGSNKKKTEIVM